MVLFKIFKSIMSYFLTPEPIASCVSSFPVIFSSPVYSCFNTLVTADKEPIYAKALFYFTFCKPSFIVGTSMIFKLG